MKNRGRISYSSEAGGYGGGSVVTGGVTQGGQVSQKWN